MNEIAVNTLSARPPALIASYPCPPLSAPLCAPVARSQGSYKSLPEGHCAG